MKIKESTEILREFLSRNAGTPHERRLQVLLALKENPHQSWREVARSLDIPKRTVENWLRLYRREGIEALLALQARAPRKSAKTGNEAPATEQGESDRAKALMNSLPLSLNTVEWGTELRHALLAYLGDVDHIVVVVCTTLDLVHPDTNRHGQFHNQSYYTRTEKARVHVTGTSERKGWETVVERGERDGFPLHLYHPAIGFDYFYKTSESYLGSILLLRLKNKPRISPRTLARLEELRPFLVYVLSDHVARQRLLNPADLIFRDLVPRIAADAKLTEREQQVLMLMVVNYTKAEMAEHLNITVQTVASHIRHIYAKTGVSRAGDIWSRYMTPQLLSKAP